jgi:hypothetical protein
MPAVWTLPFEIEIIERLRRWKSSPEETLIKMHLVQWPGQ